MEEKWDDIWSRISTVYKDLTASEQEKTQESLQSAIDLLKEKYGETEGQVVHKLKNIIEDVQKLKD